MDIITKTVKQPLSTFLYTHTGSLKISTILFILTIIFYIIIRNKLKKFNKEKINNNVSPLSYDQQNKLKEEEELLESSYVLIYSGIWITGILFFTNFLFTGYETYNYYQNDKKTEVEASIVEIKNKIEIIDDKLTIKELPEDYSYVKEYLNKNEAHDFKIKKDEFYQDSEVKLIDIKDRKYKLSGKDFKELESQRK